MPASTRIRWLSAWLIVGLWLAFATEARDAADWPRVVLQGEAGAAVPAFADASRQKSREVMVREQIRARGVRDEKVLEAMRRVPRHEFVPPQLQTRAYSDTPLPIGHGQTISQPYIVGYMTEVLALDGDERVLEVGTGSAYQAAILADIVDEVVSIEIIPALAESAAARLKRLGFGNVTVLQGDGYYGYEARAPYDAIIVTAAASHVPPPLVAQLKPGGRMVIPVGRSGWVQNLLLVEKNRRGDTSTRNLMAVQFVPLTGGH